MSNFQNFRQSIKDKAIERGITVLDCKYDDTIDMTGAKNVITKVNGEINL